MPYEKTYTADSPECVLYKQIDPNMTDEMVSICVQDIHQKVLRGENILTTINTKEIVEQITTMINDWCAANPETVGGDDDSHSDV